jgi:hypothetical protein
MFFRREDKMPLPRLQHTSSMPGLIPIAIAIAIPILLPIFIRQTFLSGGRSDSDGRQDHAQETHLRMKRTYTRPTVCFVLAFLPAGPVVADLELLLFSSIDGKPPSLRDQVEIRIEKSCRLFTVPKETVPDRKPVCYFGRELTGYIDNRGTRFRKWNAQTAVSINWYKIEPCMLHEDKGHDPTSPGWLWYTNAYTPNPRKTEAGWVSTPSTI